MLLNLGTVRRFVLAASVFAVGIIAVGTAGASANGDAGGTLVNASEAFGEELPIWLEAPEMVYIGDAHVPDDGELGVGPMSHENSCVNLRGCLWTKVNRAGNPFRVLHPTTGVRGPFNRYARSARNRFGNRVLAIWNASGTMTACMNPGQTRNNLSGSLKGTYAGVTALGYRCNPAF